MCVYCYCGDETWKWDPPFKTSDPLVPITAPGVIPRYDWPVERMREYLELLKQIKALEDQLGCPCEPSKADYIGIMKAKIAELEAASRSRARVAKKAIKAVRVKKAAKERRPSR